MRSRRNRANGGWSLMELVVVLAIIAILASIITPMITSYIDRARINTARNDVRNIAAAIISFNTDTRIWPIYVDQSDIPNGDAYDALETDGDVPTDNSTDDAWTTGTNGDMSAVINENSLALTTIGLRAWNGAYMNDISTDPWGTKYYMNATFLKPGQEEAVFVISAGPDKTLDTEHDQDPNVAAFAVGGDDIVHRIR